MWWWSGVEKTVSLAATVGVYVDKLTPHKWYRIGMWHNHVHTTHTLPKMAAGNHDDSASRFMLFVLLCRTPFLKLDCLTLHWALNSWLPFISHMGGRTCQFTQLANEQGRRWSLSNGNNRSYSRHQKGLPCCPPLPISSTGIFGIGLEFDITNNRS